MQHSPTHEHYRDMFVFIVNQIVWPELAPPVHVISSLPVLYIFVTFNPEYPRVDPETVQQHCSDHRVH